MGSTLRVPEQKSVQKPSTVDKIPASSKMVGHCGNGDGGERFCFANFFLPAFRPRPALYTTKRKRGARYRLEVENPPSLWEASTDCFIIEERIEVNFTLTAEQWHPCFTQAKSRGHTKSLAATTRSPAIQLPDAYRTILHASGFANVFS